MSASPNVAPLELALDIGHSSIGWAVLGTREPGRPEVLGCGTVLFQKDSALANARRLHRSQRRHVRATRQRIARMEKLLVHLGVFTEQELKAKHAANGGHPTPWLLAARVLASDGKQTLTWPELWDVLRWYAHNRGYEEIGAEPKDPDEPRSEGEDDDAEKVANAKAALAKFGKQTMAETICACLSQDPASPRRGTTVSYKANKWAFERPLVRAELARILSSHRAKLPHVDEALIAALVLDANAIKVPTFRLPRRFQDGLLFGRLATRYHNRIIGRCPVSGQKIPNKSSPEFLRYRWAMQLANMRVSGSADGPMRPLSQEERSSLHAAMLKDGALTPGELKKLVAALPGNARSNLEQLFLHPDAKEALILDPIQKVITGHALLSPVWATLPPLLQVRARGRLRRGKVTTLARLREDAAALDHDCTAFDQAVEALCAAPKRKTKAKAAPPTRDELLRSPIDARRELAKLAGRAPYARPLLSKAFEDVMAGRDPKASGGCLEETDEVRRRREARPVDQQTNNHLVRHRLQILRRLVSDLVRAPAYAGGDAKRISQVTIEVNRGLRTMAGLTAQDIAKELGKRLKQHGDAVAWLESDDQVARKVTAGLIRKARVALDLGRCCPYTGQEFSPVDLISKRVDLDHIVPRSQRSSDSLDSLALTFSAVNRWKGQRTAWRFIQEEGGKPVPDAPHLSIMTPARFKAHVDGLDTKGHPDDYRRKKRRKEFFLLESYEEGTRTFTPGQLTQTSQLTRLGALTVRQALPHLEPHKFVALPGSVTGAVRKAWDALGCLATAAPGVLERVREPDGTERDEVRTKTEIRDITHLHHALDACILALTAHFIPNRGNVWKLLGERRISPAQQAELAALGLMDFDEKGRFRLRDLGSGLKDQIRQRLAERRVVQHIPADMRGLSVEENTRGVEDIANGFVHLRQRKPDGEGRTVVNRTREPLSKVIGLPRDGAVPGKLALLKGVRVIDSNYGIAILDNQDLEPSARLVVIRFAQVWATLQRLRVQNGNRRVRLLRNGMLIRVPRGSRAGTWRVISAKETQAFGIAVDLATPDGTSLAKGNAPVATLVKDGMEIIGGALCGN